VYLKEAFFRVISMVKKLFSQGCGNPMKGCNKKRWCQQDHQATPLSKKSTCGPARVCGVRGDRKHCARLAALGVYPGNEIELISPSNGRECIVKVHGGTISFDRDTTDNIIISE
jgi:ferrous iron transport protein A